MGLVTEVGRYVYAQVVNGVLGLKSDVFNTVVKVNFTGNAACVRYKLTFLKVGFMFPGIGPVREEGKIVL